MTGEKLKIKVCGMRFADNIAEVSAATPNYLGFIFYPKSPRYIAQELNKSKLNKLIPASCHKVAVFVNEATENIINIAQEYDFQYIQLHGNELPSTCEYLQSKKLKVIKAFSIDQNFDFSRLDAYLDVVDYFLFDTKCKNYGGSGQKFDWNILHKYKLHKPFFLSGGIQESDTDQIKSFNHPQLYGVDINSGFEISPALKDARSIKNFRGKLVDN